MPGTFTDIKGKPTGPGAGCLENELRFLCKSDRHDPSLLSLASNERGQPLYLEMVAFAFWLNPTAFFLFYVQWGVGAVVIPRHCIGNPHALSGWEQYPSIFTQRLCVRSLATADLGPHLRVSQGCITVSPGVLSPPGTWGHLPASFRVLADAPSCGCRPGALRSWGQRLPVGISHCGCVSPPCRQESTSCARSQLFKGSPDEARPTHPRSCPFQQNTVS